jgi:chemotaxis protein MotA
MKVDFLLIGGYVGIVLVVLIGVTLAHGKLQEIWSAEGFVLAFGGAICGTIALLTGTDLKMFKGSLRIAFTRTDFDYVKLIREFGEYATISRKDGILALENVANRVEDPFLRRALRMAVDGVTPTRSRIAWRRSCRVSTSGTAAPRASSTTLRPCLPLSE